MDSEKYQNLLAEVRRFMPKDKLDSALSYTKSSMRIDAVSDLMRNAFLRSSIGMFNGCPHYFSGRIYESMSWDDFGNLIYDLMRRCNLPDGDYSRVEGIIKVCKRVVSGKQLQLNTAIMVFKNCVLDMRRKKSYNFHRKWVQVSCVDYKYDPDEHVSAWKHFLEQVLPNPVLRDVLQEFLGSIFIDRKDAKMETMLVLKGNGSNGKSVVFETVMGILGRENVSNFGISALISGSDRKKNIAYINGKRLNYCSEIQALEFGKDSDMLKALISGEPVEARPLYGNNFTAYNIPLLMANANQMPKLNDMSNGMLRRICIIPFDVEIPPNKQKKDLAKDLAHEYPAIFNWVLEGRERFIANGYKLKGGKELERIIEEYRSESSTVLSYMFHMKYSSRIVDPAVVEPSWVYSSTLYKQYIRWCKDNEVNYENMHVFGRILKTVGFQNKRMANGVIYGIYGDVDHRMLYDKIKTMRTNTKNKRNMTEVIHKQGKRLVYTVEGLSAATGVSLSQIEKAFNGGMFNGMFHKEGRTTVFYLDECERRLREKHVVGFLKKTNDEILGEMKAKSEMRKKFNGIMSKNGLPFRKYKDAERQNIPGVIIVSDEWEFDGKKAQALIKKRDKEEREKAMRV